jgi:hypothetical protein
MASNSETINFIKENYQVTQSGDALILENFETEGGRTQTLYVHMYDGLMTVTSPFAKTDSITAEQAIAAAEPEILGITRVGSFYAVIHAVPLADLDPSEVNIAFALVTNLSDGLEKGLGLGDNF